MVNAKFRGVWIVAVIASSLFGCASKEPGFYRHSPTIAQLEIPPDLTKPDFQDNFEIPQVGISLTKEPLLSDGTKVKLQRDGRLRWLEISAEPVTVWGYVRDFWSSKDIPVAWQDIKLGVMETEWLRNYDTSFAKDRFRVRVEPGATKGTTNLYVIHRGIQQHIGDIEAIPVWTDRLGDPELEIEVVGQMLEFFSLEPKRKQQLLEDAKQNKVESTLKLNDVPPALVVNDAQHRVWELVRLTVERMGHRIISHDKDTGVLKIKPSKDGDGVTPALFERDEEFTMRVIVAGANETRLELQAEQGPFADAQNQRNFLIRLKENL